MSERSGIVITVDTTINAAYIKLSGEDVDHTVEVNDHIMVDLDRHNVVVGIEVLDESAPLPFAQLVDRFHVHTEVVELLRTIRPDVASFVKLTSGSESARRPTTSTPVREVAA